MLLDQCSAIKNKYPDAILLFRVGDFYETFEGDAKATANVLDGLFLDTKNQAGEIAVFSIPHDSLEIALCKLVEADHKVAVCGQLEDPKTAKGLVKRGVSAFFK